MCQCTSFLRLFKESVCIYCDIRKNRIYYYTCMSFGKMDRKKGKER